MSVIATFTVPAADFTLGQTISSNPGIRVRLDRVIPAGDNFIPYFWASDDSVGHIRAELSGRRTSSRSPSSTRRTAKRSFASSGPN